MPDNKKQMIGWVVVLLLAVLALAGCSPAPATEAPTAVVIAPNTPQPTAEDDGGACAIEPVVVDAPVCPTPEPDNGPVLLKGTFDYSNDFVLEQYYYEHAVGLVDMTGFVLRDREWELPVESQVLGFMGLDEENNRGTFHLQLPARPYGTLNDVNPAAADTGVQIFTLAYMGNLTGGPFSEGDDKSEGWPGYLASIRLTAGSEREVVGGMLVVWAPDSAQSFPTTFGEDGLLFTADDPVEELPAGYTLIDLDQEPFARIREPEVELTLYEPTDIALKDYSEMSYTEAFNTMFEKARQEYAFNGVEGKQPDWDALYERVAPLVEDAQRRKDGRDFFLALREFTFGFKDGHVSVSSDRYSSLVWQQISGGYGVSIRELDDGQVIAAFVLPGGPADLAGIQDGAQITAVNGLPVTQAIDAVEPVTAPFSTDFTRRFEQARLLVRATPGSTISVSYINPGGSQQNATLQAIDESYSYFATAQYFYYNPYAPPVEYWFLQSGVGYVRINSNSDDLNLTIRLFERALKTFEENDALGLIIDMRQNSGGSPLGLAGYLTTNEISLGTLEYYDEKTGKFEPRGTESKVRPNQNQYSFRRMALLVDQTCYSACEIEAYAFSQVPGMTVIGQYPTAGVEAEVARGQYKMPEDITVVVPTGRFVLPDGSIFLEGVGVQPTIRVPVNSEAVLSQNDYVLMVAERRLTGR